MSLRQRPWVPAAILSASLVATSVSAAPVVEEDPVELIRQGRHLDAAEAFERQYERTGDAALLFAKATALRRGGDCRGAVEALERFIDAGPPEPDVAAAREIIAVCSEILEDEPAPVPPPVLVSPAPEPEPASEPEPEPEPEPERHWNRDVPGGVLLGTGAAIAVGGAVLLGVGAARMQPREESEAGFERREQSVRVLFGAGGSMVGAGTALLVGSIIRYVMVARRSDRRR